MSSPGRGGENSEEPETGERGDGDLLPTVSPVHLGIPPGSWWHQKVL